MLDQLYPKIINDNIFKVRNPTGDMHLPDHMPVLQLHMD
jgi:hypothetical protein